MTETTIDKGALEAAASAISNAYGFHGVATVEYRTVATAAIEAYLAALPVSKEAVSAPEWLMTTRKLGGSQWANRPRRSPQPSAKGTPDVCLSPLGENMNLTYPAEFLTVEEEPRRLVVKGRSAMDPDVVVGYAKGNAEPLWIVCDEINFDRHQSYAVFGLEPGIRAIYLAAARKAEAA
jgi:hypothetical protein